jgi:hypothetical protein
MATLLAAMASSRASPEVIAKTMMVALQDSGDSFEADLKTSQYLVYCLSTHNR